MLDTNHLPQDYIDQVKRHLHITWTDQDTDARVVDIMTDAEAALNHKLGAEPDYFSPGQERRLYLAYCLYLWNDCAEQFDAAYRAEIMQIRHKYSVQRQVQEEADDETEVSDV